MKQPMRACGPTEGGRKVHATRARRLTRAMVSFRKEHPMRRHMCTLLASLSVGAMSLFLATSFLRADDPNAPPAAGMRTSLQLPAGFTQKDLKEEKDIKNELASLTENAVTKDHFDN